MGKFKISLINGNFIAAFIKKIVSTRKEARPASTYISVLGEPYLVSSLMPFLRHRNYVSYRKINPRWVWSKLQRIFLGMCYRMCIRNMINIKCSTINFSLNVTTIVLLKQPQVNAVKCQFKKKSGQDNITFKQIKINFQRRAIEKYKFVFM